MTYQQIVDEILNLRFDEFWRASAKRWVQARLARLWTAQDWTFAMAEVAASTSAGSPNLVPDLPDLAIVHDLYNAQGAELVWVDSSSFNSYFSGSRSPGSPGFYTIVNGAIKLGPTPGADETGWLLSYKRRTPALVDGDEIPYLPEAWHYVLVDGGLAEGLHTVQDPSHLEAESVWDADLAALAVDYVADQRGHTTVWPTNQG